MVHQNKWSGNKKNRLIEGEKMTHLSVEEILGYIKAKKADAETLAFIARVNEHVLSCESCREKLEAFEAVDLEMCNIAFESHMKNQQEQEAELVL